MAPSARGLLTGRPPTSIEPAVGATSPPITRRSDVLPHPDGPTRATNSPVATCKSMSSSTSRCPYLSDTDRIDTAGAVATAALLAGVNELANIYRLLQHSQIAAD